MPVSRRSFLRTSALVASVPLFSTASASGQSHSAAGTTAAKPNPKAGLLFDKADLPRIRANLEHPRLAGLRKKITVFNYD